MCIEYRLLHTGFFAKVFFEAIRLTENGSELEPSLMSYANKTPSVVPTNNFEPKKKLDNHSSKKKGKNKVRRIEDDEKEKRNDRERRVK